MPNTPESQLEASIASVGSQQTHGLLHSRRGLLNELFEGELVRDEAHVEDCVFVFANLSRRK